MGAGGWVGGVRIFGKCVRGTTGHDKHGVRRLAWVCYIIVGTSVCSEGGLLELYIWCYNIVQLSIVPVRYCKTAPFLTSLLFSSSFPTRRCIGSFYLSPFATLLSFLILFISLLAALTLPPMPSSMFSLSLRLSSLTSSSTNFPISPARHR